MQTPLLRFIVLGAAGGVYQTAEIMERLKKDEAARLSLRWPRTSRFRLVNPLMGLFCFALPRSLAIGSRTFNPLGALATLCLILEITAAKRSSHNSEKKPTQ
eukprot:6483257-Amphidinium_carterae.1